MQIENLCFLSNFVNFEIKQMPNVISKQSKILFTFSSILKNVSLRARLGLPLSRLIKNSRLILGIGVYLTRSGHNGVPIGKTLRLELIVG